MDWFSSVLNFKNWFFPNRKCIQLECEKTADDPKFLLCGVVASKDHFKVLAEKKSVETLKDPSNFTKQ